MKLQAALNEFAQMHADLVRLRRPREGEQVLHNLSGAAGLAMSEFELPAGDIVGSGIPEQFGDAQHRGERVIQLVGDSGDHLAHGGKSLGLDQLLLDALGLGDIAGGRDDALDLSGCPVERAGGSAEQAHFAVLALDKVFDAAVGAFSGKHGLEQRAHLLAVPGGHALAQQCANHFLGGEAKQFLRSRTHERVAAFTIQRHDQVGKAFHQAAREFLLAVQALLHLAALGDIDERSLVAANAACRCRESGRRRAGK